MREYALVDAIGPAADNFTMSTGSNAKVEADTYALMKRIVCGVPLPADIYQRIQERGDELTEEIRQKHGTIEIAVDLVRGIRDDE